MQKKTWVIAIVFLIFAAIWFLFKSKPEILSFATTATPTFQEYHSKPIFGDTTEIVTALKIEGDNGQVTEIKRGDDGAWQLEAPLALPAEQSTAEAAASQAAAIGTLKELDPAPADSDMGLDKPTYIISLTFGGGEPLVLQIGDKTPTGSGYYARLEGGKAVILSPYGVEALTMLLTNPPIAAP